MQIHNIKPVGAISLQERLDRYRDEIRARAAHLPAATAASLGGTGWHKPTPADRPISHDAMWKRNGELS